MAKYEGRLTSAELKRAGEMGEYLAKKGRWRGGVNFFGGKWTVFDSDEVAFDVIKTACEPRVDFYGKKETGELEIHLVGEGRPVTPEVDEGEHKRPVGRPPKSNKGE